MQQLTLGEYQVCFNEGSGWRNTGIALYLQEKLLGLSIAGIRNAGGTRSAVAKSSNYSVSLEYFPGGGRERHVGDELLIVETGKRCAALSPEERTAGALSSGILRFDGESVSGAQHLVRMHPIWYQVRVFTSLLMRCSCTPHHRHLPTDELHAPHLAPDVLQGGRVCVCVCARARACACVRACVRACVCRHFHELKTLCC